LVIKRVRVLGSGPHTPTQFFGECPRPVHFPFALFSNSLNLTGRKDTLRVGLEDSELPLNFKQVKRFGA